MRKLLPILLTIAVVLFNPIVVLSADFQKGLDAYEKGDYATALREWQPLAEQGNAYAQYNLGVMYDNGQGVPEDDKEALRLYRLPAGQWHADAQNNLGVMYEDIIEDKVLAHMWWNIAALQGHENARQNRDNIEERMPLQHIEEAQNLSRECVENNFKECGEQKSWWKVWD